MKHSKIIRLWEENDRKVVLFFFIALLAAGLFLFRDFGVSWDEEYQWRNNGEVNYNFIVHGDQNTLLQGIDKYHGPAFELVLTGVQKAFRMTDTRIIFFMRHLVTFLLFYLSAIFFYLLALKLFKSRGIALTGLLLYVLSPHIFSHAFYNSKDPVFLGFFVISMYFMQLFMEKQSIRNAALLGLATAFTIDVRVIGILIPLFFVYCLLHQIICTKTLRTASGRNILLPALVFFIVLIPCIILFWPVLWLDPVHHFIEALKENSKYPFDAPVLYFGKWYTPTTLPRHYLFFWMFISRPVLYSVLFVTGLIALAAKSVTKPLAFFRGQPMAQLSLAWFFLPLLAMLVFGSPAFDTGRHLYFLHGAFVLLSLYGLQALLAWMKERGRLQAVFTAVLALSFLGAVYRMAQLHPYEHLYFNETAGNDLKRQQDNFEFDYWGLAARNTLEQLLKKDPSSPLIVWAEHLPGQINTYLLKPGDRARLQCRKNIPFARYFLADYRWQRAEQYPYKEVVCSTVLGNATLAGILKIKPE